MTSWQQRIHEFLERSTLADADAKAVPLTGDASDRRYVRLFPRAGDSFVLAIYTDPFEYDTLPFVIVSTLLKRMVIPVPAILEHAPDLGILALEDLGDVTLQAHLGTAPSEDHLALYYEAVDLIAILQDQGRSWQSSTLLPYTLAFDTKKLSWELEFFLTHFVEAYRGVSLSKASHAELSGEFRQLADELAGEPRVLCHRDFHSRNLMLHAGRLYVIDFQDARMGPATYDLASLLRDAYADLSEDSVVALIERFVARAGLTMGAGAFRQRFDVMALQRNLKALGTFGYQTAVRRNPVYIQYIPRTLRYIRDTLKRHRRFERLHDALAMHLPELR